MNKKIFLTTIILLFLVSNFCLAQRRLEFPYPMIDAIQPRTVKQALPEYVKYIFTFFVAIIGLVCFGGLVYAGIRYLTSAGDPGVYKDAQSQILASFLGLILVLTSYIISRTINPQLVIPEAQITISGGLTLYTSNDCTTDESDEEKRIITKDTPSFGTKSDGTTPFQPGSLKFMSGPGELAVAFYENENYEGNETMQLSSDISGENECRPLPAQGRSIKLIWKLPGIYLCTDRYSDWDDALQTYRCLGKERYLLYSNPLLEPDLNDKIRGLKIQPSMEITPIPWLDCLLGTGKKQECIAKKGIARCSLLPVSGFCYLVRESYGVVLHEHADFTGDCEVFVFIQESTRPARPYVVNLEESRVIGARTSSVTYFVKKTTQLEGGVFLCKEENANREDAGCFGPFQLEGRNCNLDEQACYPDQPNWGIKPVHVNDKGIPDGIPDTTGSCLLSYTGLSDYNGISSIIIDGAYVAILFDEADGTGSCEVFKQSDSNFRDNPIGRCCCVLGNYGCGDCLTSFIILPTGAW